MNLKVSHSNTNHVLRAYSWDLEKRQDGSQKVRYEITVTVSPSAPFEEADSVEVEVRGDGFVASYDATIESVEAAKVPGVEPRVVIVTDSVSVSSNGMKHGLAG